MKIDPGLKKFIEEAQQDIEVRVELVKMDFASALEEQRRATGVTYKQVAEALKKSPAYVSKVFRGDSNLTIESLVKFAEATGGKLEIRVVPAVVAAEPIAEAPKVRWLKLHMGNAIKFEGSYTDSTSLFCANHDLQLNAA
jgi:transcriptional regulator with XRE-family HTH domain